MSEQPHTPSVTPTGRPGTIGLLGATGRLGRRVARLLQAAGTDHTLLARDTASPRLPVGAHTLDVRPAHYDDPAELARSFAGLDTLLMVSATESPERLAWHANIIDAASAAGVRHLVYTSFIGAAPGATFTFARDHSATEQLLRDATAAGGPDFTALRDSFYLEALVSFVGPDGVLRGPAGEGRVSAVSRDDVAAVAARVLSAPAEFSGEILEITGREALTLDEVADIISQETGRATRYENESLEEAYASREPYGAPDWQVDAWVSTYTAIAAGEEQRVTNEVRRITGHEPLTLRDILRR